MEQKLPRGLILRGEIYWIDIKGVGGKRLRESTGTSNLKLAEKYLSKKRNEVTECEKLDILPDRPLKEAVEFFIKQKRREGLRTVDQYEQQLEWWLEQLEGVTLQQVSEAKIVSAILKMQETVTHLGTPPTNATLNRYLAALRACLNVALAHKQILAVPRFVRYKEPKERVRWLSTEERLLLLDACPDHWRGMVRLSLATGLRQSNVRELRWEWVDLESKVLTIPGEEFKNGDEFCIPLNEEAMSAIVAEAGKHEEFVFTYQGRPMSQISHTAWKTVLEKAGIEDFRWHDLRHTWATDKARDGVPTQALQKLGGWKTLAMVNKYAHHDVESLRQWVNPVRPTQQPEPSTTSNQPLPETTPQLRHNEASFAGKPQLKLVVNGRN